jgi:predicted permease
MSWLRVLASRIRGLFSKRRLERELDEELHTHIEIATAEYVRKGLSPEDASHAAQRDFGGVEQTKEVYRQRLGLPWIETILGEVRYAIRILGKSPGFTSVALVTLALGIGTSTAVFTAVDSVLLKPLAYHDSGSLVATWERVRFLSGDPTGPNPRHVDVWRKRATAFSGLTFLRHTATGLTVGTQHPLLVGAVVCSPNLFDILQVQPLVGRTFNGEDAVEGHDNVAILTYSLWQNLFHGDSGVIGKTIRLGDVSRVVIGVLPTGFHFPSGSALRSFRRVGQTLGGASEPVVFFPAALDLTQFPWNGNYGNWVALGRLNPGFTIIQAETQLNAIQTQIVQEMPANQGDHSPGSLAASVQPLQEAMVEDSKMGLWLLMSAVFGLMLIACLNLANAQLGRAMARSREAALRAALGASRWRLIWNPLTENILLAAIGGSAGIVLCYASLYVFRHYPPIDLPRLAEVHLNHTVLIFSVALIVAASLLCGMLPALRLLSTDPHAALQQSNSRTLGSCQSNRLRRWLIGLQVCGCTALLLVTGLFSKSLLHLLSQDKGFQTGHVIVAEVRLTPQAYATDQSRVSFDDAVLENLRAIPGVQTAGLVSAMPLDGESWIEFVQRVDRPHLETPLINLRWVSPGYFETTRQSLVAGRFLEERDRNTSSAVLAEGEAKVLWGNEDPIGGQVKIEGRTFTVVGVVADSRNTSLKSPPARMAYVHYKNRPPYPTFFLVRTSYSAGALASSIRQAIWKYAPEVTIARVKTLDAQLADSLATERFQTWVLLSFGTAALFLAMLGIYAVLSYSVVTRKQEIGVRLALGATRRSVYGLTLGEAGIPVFAGLVTGLVTSVMAGRVIQNLLYGVHAIDPQVIFIVTVLLLVSAATAAFLPARRAASVDPMDALRSE